MATIDDLLNAYSSDSVPEAKKRNVELATAEKLKALNGLTPTSFTDAAIATQGSDQGSASASDIEKDLRYLSDYELRDKYGEEADYLLEQRALADIGIKNTKDLARSKTGAVGVGQDVLVSTAHGLAGLIGGLAYLGTAGADAVLGTTGSNTVAEANKSVLDWVNKGHTIYNEADTKINAEQSKLNQRDTKALHDKRMKAPDANPTEAWLRRVGQDFVDEIANTGGSAEQLTNLTGEAIGSIGGIGALTKAGTKVGTKLLNSAIERELIEKGGKTATRLQKHGKEVLTTALIGATEGGSVGAEAVNRILAMDIKSLVNDPAHGERIKDLIAEHGEEKAKLLLAKEVGLAVTGETAVTAAILGKMVSKFEGNPLQKLSTKQAYAALVGQAIEETLQEGSGQHITNAQIKDKLNSTQDIAEGVGSGAAKGFLGGVMGNTALTPVALSRPVVDPSIAVTKFLGKQVGKQAANLAKHVYTGVLSKIEEKSPVSDTNVAKAASAILPTIPEAKAAAETVINTPNATPENIKAAEYTNKLLDALVFEAPPKGVLSPLFDTEFEGVTSTIEAAQKLSKIINDKSVSEDDRFTAIENLHGLMTGVSDALLEGAEEALPEMENLPELKQYADNFTALVNSFKDSPAMKAVMPHFENILETGMAMGHYQEIDVNNLADPAQQENLDRILKVATTTNGALPEKLGTSLTTIMDMINTDKDVGITKAQQAAIIGLATEMRIGQQLSTVAALMGLPNVDMVNRQITLDEAVDQTHIFPSAREHSRGITAAMAKEDLALAKTRLQTLQNFAVHLNNKVEALNKHIATAKAGSKTTVPFKGYRVVFGEEWSLTPKGVYVNLNSTKSKQLAKTVSLEALALTNIYNQLVKAFPELDFKSIKSVEINPVVNDGVAVNANRESIVNTSVATDTSNNTAQENTDPENNTDSIEEDTNTGNRGNDNNTEPDVHVKKWVKLITHFKGLGRLNEIKKTIPTDMGERIVKVLQGLPKDFQVDGEYQDDFKEVKEYFLGKTEEKTSSRNEDNSRNTSPSSSNKSPVKSKTPEYLDKWGKLLTYFKGLGRLNEVKKDISTELGERVVKVLESLPKDFQVDEEYRDDFNEIKEYFLGKPEEETTSNVDLVEMYDSIKTGVSSVGAQEFKANPEQQEGINKIRDFLSGKTEGNVFVLEGKAGTGKTSLIQEALAPYLRSGGIVHISAVSHKAKSVLEGKLREFIRKNDLRGDVLAKSLAGMLGMKRNEVTGDFEEDPFNQTPSISFARVLIVDEASMVNTQNKKILEKMLPKGAKLIYLGDRNQIAPIEPKDSPNAGQISQVFSMDTGVNKHSLVTRVRQGEDSSILPYADYYWNNAESKNPNRDPVPEKGRKSTSELVMLNSEGWLDKVIPLFKKGFDTKNPNLVKILAFNNLLNDTAGARMLRKAEQAIRESLFGKDLKEYNEGELVILNNGFRLSDEVILENSTEYVVEKYKPITVDVPTADTKIVSLDAYKVSIKDTLTGLRYDIPVLARHEVERHKDIYNAWAKKAKAGAGGHAWDKFWDIKDTYFAPITYSYIITTHKAQGSTYDVSVVLEDNIQGSPDKVANVSRIMYTAITRASKLAIIVSGKNNKKVSIPSTKSKITASNYPWARTADNSYEVSKENPELLKDLREKAKGKTLTDKFASTDISQERALSEPLNQKEAISSSSNSNNNNNTTEENPSNKVTSENTFDAIKKEERAATENSIQETTVKPTENSKHVEKSSENSSNNSIKTARTSSSKISKNTESIDINSDHVLSPDYLTSIETLQGTFDSPMQAIVVSLYGVIKRTPENHALMLQALETTDPDKLREILGSYKTPQKTLIEKLEKIAKEVYSSYIHGNAAALAEATKANAFTLNFSDQNKFWQVLLPNVLKEIAEEIKLINEVPYSEEISTKANFKELLSNLVLGAKSRVFNAFSLGSDKTTNLLNQTSPLGFIIDSLDNTNQEESTFKIQAKKRWKALLAEEVPNIVNTLGENVRSFLQNKVPVTERTKLNSIALIVVNSLKEKELHPTIKTILDDLGITNDQLELYTTYAKHEATVKANEEAIKDLLDAQSIWKKEQSKQEIKTNWEYGDLLQSREEELVKAKKWLAENSLDEPLAKFRSALVKVQGEIPLHTLMELRELHQTPNGKLMNFLVQTDGNYDLDPRIAEAIAIAGISWIAGNATNGTSLDRKELADVLNMEVWEISGEALRTADKAVFSGIVTQGVADSIRKILNLGEKQNGYIGDTQGLLLSLSANVVEALKDNGLLDMHTINAMDKETKKIHKSFNYYRATPFVGTIYSAVSEVIEDIVVEEHLKKPRFSLGSPHSLPIPNKLKHSSVDVTSDQKIMVENANRVPTFVNLPIYNFFKAIGTEGLVKLFAHGELDEDLLHPEDYVSKLGKNRSISDAWEKAEVMLKDIAHFANKREKGVDQIPIYFGKAVNSTSRLDFEESYNIQASKVNRPVFVATRKLVNLTSNKNKVNFLRGIAQGMGIKIHNLSAENALAKLQAVLETPEVVNALKLIGEHKEVFTEEDINILKAVMPFVDNTEWGLTNLVEYQRYIATPEKDLHKFVTPVAIEADGATNGVANSLHLLTNTITTRLIQLWKMTGFFIGSDTRSLNEEREFNPTDIYLSAAKGVTGYLDTYKREFYKKQPEELFPAYEGGEILTRLLNVTVTVDSAGNIELTRPSTKNPVTVSVYRSSVNGIAEKVTGELVKELYTQISLKLRGTGNLMIPTYYEELVHAFNLIDDTIKLPPIDASNATWRAFSLDSFNLVHIVDAIKYSYAQPLYNVISDQVLGTVNLAANTMVKLANMQGALIKEAYERAIREKIEDKLKNEPSYRRSDYLTHKELKDISADIIKRFGGVINDTYQNATVFMKSVKSSVAGMPHTAASLQDTVRAYPSIETFGEPGVSIVPNSVIRGGDALMIQHFINDPENDIHNLPIFDGIMVNVKDIEKASLLANKAVYRTWTEGTPMEAVVNAFEKALASVEFSKISTETANAIMTTAGLNKTELQNTSVKQILEDTLALAKNIVIDIKAQQEVVKRLPSSVDQMASIGNPYHVEGTLQLSEELIEKLSGNVSEDELAEALEEERALIAAELRKATGSKGENTPPKSELVVLDSTNIVEELKGLAAEDPQYSKLMGVAESIVGAFKQATYTILRGDSKDVHDYLMKAGDTESAKHALESNEGFINHKKRVIVTKGKKFIVLLHEMIHASISYSLSIGLNTKDPKTSAEKRAVSSVKQIKVMFSEFVSEEFAEHFKNDSKALDVYLAIKQALLGKYKDDEYIQLNEFLAHVLGNNRMLNVLSNVPTKATIASKFLEGIRKAIARFFEWSNNSPESKDFFSTLVFHATTLAHDNLVFNDLKSTLPTSDYALGSRLDTLHTKLKAKFKDKLKGANVVEKTQLLDAALKEKKLADDIIAAGFYLDQEELNLYAAMNLAMKIGLDTNAVARTQLQEVFAKILQNIKVSHFYPNANPTQDEKDVAADKLHAVFGRYRGGGSIRQDTLANFIALATVSPELQKIINEIAIQEFGLADNTRDAFDLWVGNLGNKIIDNLSDYSSKVDKRSKELDTYFNALVDVLFNAEQDSKLQNNALLKAVGSNAEKANDWLVDNLQKGSQKANELTQPLRDSSNKLANFTGNVVQTLNAIVNKDIAEIAVQDINRSFNRVEGFQEFRDFLKDIFGRTEDNAKVYDLVKPIRTYVDKVRQAYKGTVPVIIKQKFTKPVTKEEYAVLSTAMGKTMLHTLGSSNMIRLATGKLAANSRIIQLEDKLKAIDADYFVGVSEKAKQLAEYNINGIAGDMLLRNPYTIAYRFDGYTGSAPKINPAYVNAVAELISLYSYELLSNSDKETLNKLATQDPDALVFMGRFLNSIHEHDAQSLEVNLTAKANSYFGHLPQIIESEGHLRIANDSEFTDLVSQGYVRVGDYVGDSRDPLKTKARGYYYNPLNTGLEYKQGIIQTIQGSAGGVDLETGLTVSKLSAGLISDPSEIKRILNGKYKESDEPLLPVFNGERKLIAFERTVSNKQLARLELNKDLPTLLGAMRGRQAEENLARTFLNMSLDALVDTYENDPDKSQYIDLFDKKAVAKDKVLEFGVSLFSRTAKDEIKRRFGDSFYVKREMLTDVVGFRKASVTDVFTGISRYSPETIKTLRAIALSVFGENAYKYMAYSEKYLQEGVSYIKGNIIVRSVVVPVANILSNAMHLLSLGIPLQYTLRAIPKKIAELEHYSKARVRLMSIEIEMAAANKNDSVLMKRLIAEKKSLESTLERMSIAPLIVAGELSNINDVGLDDTDKLLFTKRLGEYFSTLINKTPKGVKTVGKHLLVAEDTALYAGLQKSVLYGDFIAKAIQYDYLTQVKKVKSQEAIVTVSSEFISYDHLPGRGRDYLESMGLLWFYNYKLRSVRVALNVIRNNPLYGLIYGGMLGTQLGIDSPLDSNVVSQVFDGTIGNSLGIGMGIDGIFSNPYVNLIT